MIVCPECGGCLAGSMREIVHRLPRLLKVACGCFSLEVTYENSSGGIWRLDMVLSYRQGFGSRAYCTDLVTRHLVITDVDAAGDIMPDVPVWHPTLESLGESLSRDIEGWTVAGVLGS